MLTDQGLLRANLQQRVEIALRCEHGAGRADWQPPGNAPGTGLAPREDAAPQGVRVTAQGTALLSSARGSGGPI